MALILTLSKSKLNPMKDSAMMINEKGELITVTVLDVKDNQVRLRIEAPHNILIYRQKIFYRILEENQGKIPGTTYLSDRHLI